ncbi:MAG: dTMP kinase, partial [Candidatus Wildermuthbacteria bacterium]|nr:dTMP kinase [Candidatus Wildermuthbacteria bacterium]
MIKNHYPGKFIVFEGIDGAGKGTQSNLLFNFLKNKNVQVKKFQYPEYEGPIGKLIKDFLYKKYELSADTQFLLYFADFLKDSQKIKDYLKAGKIVICDRYLNSALAYQGLRGFPVENALKIAEIFGIPRPDLVIY